MGKSFGLGWIQWWIRINPALNKKFIIKNQNYMLKKIAAFDKTGNDWDRD